MEHGMIKKKKTVAKIDCKLWAEGKLIKKQGGFYWFKNHFSNSFLVAMEVI